VTITDADGCRLPRPGRSRSDAEELKGYSSEAGAVVPDHFQVQVDFPDGDGCRSIRRHFCTPTQPKRTLIRGERCARPLFRIFGRPRYAMMSRCSPSVAMVAFRAVCDMCDEKHKGSRAVVALCRTVGAANARFGVTGEEKRGRSGPARAGSPSTIALLKDFSPDCVCQGNWLDSRHASTRRYEI
jgi:hypothetical protein